MASAMQTLSSARTAAAGSCGLAPRSATGPVVPVPHVVLTWVGSGFAALS